MLAFYPDNLLYLFLPAHIAFNLHFLIHLIAGAWAIRHLARRYGCDDWTSRVAAVLYVLSGPVISALAFYNLIAAVALIPLSFLAIETFLHRPDWEATLILGSVYGLLALAGEPVIFAGAVVSGAILAAARVARHPARAAIVTRGMIAAAVAALVALPLLLAYGEIASEVERATWRFSTQTVLAASLTPSQLAETLLGPFRGLITDLGPSGYRANPGATGWPPLFLSSFLGAIVLPALLVRGRHVAPYRWILAVLLFVALGRFNPIVRAIVEEFPAARIIRYPEKFALGITVAAVLLIAAWMGRREQRIAVRVAALLGVAVIVTIVGAGLASQGSLTALSKRRLVMGGAVAIVALACVAMAERFELARKGAILLTIVPLAYWAARAAPVDWMRPYREPSPLLEPALEPWQRVARPIEPQPLELSRPHARFQYRAKAQMLDPLFGAVAGVHYALDRSPDAMYFTLSRILNERIEAVPLPLQLRYLRLAGCSTLITRQALTHPQAELVTQTFADGNPVYRYRLPGALPYVRSVRRILGVRSVQQAVELLESPSFDERGDAIASLARQEASIAQPLIQRVSRRRQQIEIDLVAQHGATLVVNETYFSAWDARAYAKNSPSGTALTHFPVNIDRLGLIVPPGEWTIRLRFGRRPHLVAASWLASSLTLIATAVAAFRRSKNRTASPAR